MEKLIVIDDNKDGNGEGKVWIQRGEGNWDCVCDMVCGSNEERLSTARRLAASYNACEGLSIETLESPVANAVLTNFASTVSEFERMKAQNAQLLEALQKINGCRADGIAPDDPGGWMDFFIETARAAIAATTPQQEPDYDSQAKEYEADQRFADQPTSYDP